MGHQQRPRRIVGEADRQQREGLRRAEARLVGDRGDLAAQVELDELVRHHEAARLGRLRRSDRQQPAPRIEAAQHAAAVVGRGDDVDPVAPLERMRDQRLGQRLGVEIVGQRLGGAVDRVDIIALLVEPVAHLLPRQPVVAGHAAGDPVVDELEPFLGPAPGIVEADELVGEDRLLLDHAVEHLRPDLGIGEQRVGERLAQRRQPPLGVAGGVAVPVDREGLGERLPHRRGDRPVVILELRQIGDRQPDPRRHRRLAEPDPLPQRAQLVPREQSGAGASRHAGASSSPPSETESRKFCK
jgi:hypothetical protein